MKNIGIIIIVLLVSASSINAQLLASLSTKTQGGVMGKVNTIVPQIGFYEANTDLMAQTMIFSDVLITTAKDETIFRIDAKNGGINFQNFCSILTTDKYATLKVGHKVNKVKSHVGRTIEDWFENIDLTDEEIGNIELIVKKVSFNTPGANRTKDGNWTDFDYEITLNIYGTSTSVAQK
jgi:hypothetical protein